MANVRSKPKKVEKVELTGIDKEGRDLYNK